MAIKTGKCIFCNQAQALDVQCDANEEKLNHIATMQCECEAAKHYQNTQDIAKQIEDSLGDRFPEGSMLAKQAVAYIDSRKIKSVSIDTGECTKIKISANSKGEISVVATESHSNIIQ